MSLQTPRALAAGDVALLLEAVAGATCYGRILRPAPGEPADIALPSAVDCYRYALSQPGEGACLSAPRNHSELKQNLEVLEHPWMMPDVLAAMRAHGERLRAGNQRFNPSCGRPRSARATPCWRCSTKIRPGRARRVFSAGLG